MKRTMYTEGESMNTKKVSPKKGKRRSRKSSISLKDLQQLDNLTQNFLTFATLRCMVGHETADIGRNSGCAYSTIARLRNRQTRNPMVRTIFRVVYGCGKTLTDLLTEFDEAKKLSELGKQQIRKTPRNGRPSSRRRSPKFRPGISPPTRAAARTLQ